ncbi:MAG TPA: choline TMA-lyase-activating enzyme [Bacillota bacterium]|nr:choline TMA-lyase-activating enzyme [Bacillota bacterium]
MDNQSSGPMAESALIMNVQKYNIYDGPGVRTLVFFKGCPLRCKWCSNPEGFERKFQVMLKNSSCTDCGACVPVCPVGIFDLSKENSKLEIARNIDCIGCGKCVEACPESALSISGEVKTIAELLEIVQEDEIFYDMSDGGVTLGGGEVLAQPEAAVNLLKACKKEGINTAIETSGYAGLETILKIAEFTDLFLYDIKQINTQRHFELTGLHNGLILKNLKELLTRGYNVKIRMPLLKGINDSQDDIEGVIHYLLPFRAYKNFKGIDILPYHKLGVNKYNQLGMDYPVMGDPSMNADDLKRVETWFEKYDLPVKVIHH